MNIKEYTKTLENRIAEISNTKYDGYYAGYSDGMIEAVNLAKELDEPKKVVIPQFVADWIEEFNQCDKPLGIVIRIIQLFIDDEGQSEWRYDKDNQKLLLNAIVNGYEVED